MYLLVQATPLKNPSKWWKNPDVKPSWKAAGLPLNHGCSCRCCSGILRWEELQGRKFIVPVFTPLDLSIILGLECCSGQSVGQLLPITAGRAGLLALQIPGLQSETSHFNRLLPSQRLCRIYWSWQKILPLLPFLSPLAIGGCCAEQGEVTWPTMRAPVINHTIFI